MSFHHSAHTLQVFFWCLTLFFCQFPHARFPYSCIGGHSRPVPSSFHCPRPTLPATVSRTTIGSHLMETSSSSIQDALIFYVLAIFWLLHLELCLQNNLVFLKAQPIALTILSSASTPANVVVTTFPSSTVKSGNSTWCRSWESNWTRSTQRPLQWREHPEFAFWQHSLSLELFFYRLLNLLVCLCNICLCLICLSFLMAFCTLSFSVFWVTACLLHDWNYSCSNLFFLVAPWCSCLVPVTEFGCRTGGSNIGLGLAPNNHSNVDLRSVVPYTRTFIYIYSRLPDYLVCDSFYVFPWIKFINCIEFTISCPSV